MASTPKKLPKSTSEAIDTALEIAFIILKSSLGDKKFKRRLKKARKIMTKGVRKAVKVATNN